MRSCILILSAALCAVFSLTLASASEDVLLQAISFAITGSDGSKVMTVDRAQCVFKIENDTYYLNNVYVDRVSIQSWKNSLGQKWVTVDLHGKKKVAEHYAPPPKYTGSELDRLLMQDKPDIFAHGERSSSVDEKIKVYTSEQDRLTRAWQYIYANGCKGQTSPF